MAVHGELVGKLRKTEVLHVANYIKLFHQSLDTLVVELVALANREAPLSAAAATANKQLCLQELAKAVGVLCAIGKRVLDLFLDVVLRVALPLLGLQ